MSDQPMPGPNPTDYIEGEKLILEANLEMGRITQKEYETTKQQQKQKIKEDQELKAKQQAEFDSANKIAPGGPGVDGNK
jgi:serine phosphatase RsbU (regulator of sigma subunit)